MKYLFTCIIFIIPLFLFSQKLPSVRVLQDSIRSSFRGLSAPSDNVVWVSGTNGTVGRSVDGGKTWKWMTVPGFEKRDFRDIEAFDSSIAIIMAVDNPADILKTTDGGESWKVVFHKEVQRMFLDAMDFISETEGIVIGDPIEQTASKWKFEIINSVKGQYREFLNTPAAEPGETLFAASGTNIKLASSDFFAHNDYFNFAFVTGGSVANLHIRKTKVAPQTIKIPIMQGNPSAGAFSLYSDGKKKFYITGGDYKEYWKDSGNVVYTSNQGKTWKRSSVHGYRSCIIQADTKTFITCGTNGVDMSFNGCKTWKLIHGDGAKGTDGFNVCAKSKKGKAIYFAGNGRIGKLVL